MEIVTRLPLEKGWSADRKYRAVGPDGKTYLLRVSDIGEFEEKRREFDLMERVYSLGVPMCAPLEFGVSAEGVYSLQDWIDGYFDGPIPEEFWRTLALHICSASVSSLPWAIPFGEAEIMTMRRQEAQILRWYDDMTRTVPRWYTGKRK